MRAPFAGKKKKKSVFFTGEGRPDSSSIFWARSVPCCARSKFFFGGSGSHDFPGFLCVAFFCTFSFFEMLVCSAHSIRASLKTARLTTSLGSP